MPIVPTDQNNKLDNKLDIFSISYIGFFHRNTMPTKAVISPHAMKRNAAKGKSPAQPPGSNTYSRLKILILPATDILKKVSVK